MSKISISLNIILAITVLVLCTVVYQHKYTPELPTRESAATRNFSDDRDGIDTAANVSNAMVLDRLALLDARLTSMQRQSESAQVGSTRPPVTGPQISLKDAEIAKQRLALMFPNSTFDRKQMLHFQKEVAKFPANEQVALLSAFTQATNTDRLKPRM